MKKIYFAGPLFSEAEKIFNEKLVNIIEEFGYEVFLPQRDGYEAVKLKNLTEADKSKLVFKKDIGEIEKADIFFMVLDGRIPDEGACVELGYAYAKGKNCYGIRTDARAFELDLSMNPMISGCFIHIIDCKDKNICERIKEFLSKKKL